MGRLNRRLLPWGGGASLALPLAAAVLLATACGIPQFVFLAPPVPGTVTSLPPSASFTHDDVNDTDSFLGYELYYKFYDPGLADVTGAFRSDEVAIESAAPGSVTATLDARGYRRVYAGTIGAGDAVTAETRSPALTVGDSERDQGFTVSVTFPQDSASTEHASATWNAGSSRSIVLLRDQAALGNPATNPRSFLPADIDAADADVPGLPAAPEGTIEMGLAVAAYGTDYVTGTFSEIYSTVLVVDQLLLVAY
jgi:hypothetical protein